MRSSVSFGSNNVEDGIARKHWLQLRNLEMLHEEGYLTRQEFKVGPTLCPNSPTLSPEVASSGWGVDRRRPTMLLLSHFRCPLSHAVCTRNARLSSSMS